MNVCSIKGNILRTELQKRRGKCKGWGRRACGDVLGGTVPLFPSASAESEAGVPNRPVGSAGMGWRGGVVDGGKVVGASDGHMYTRKHSKSPTEHMRLSSLRETQSSSTVNKYTVKGN